MGTLTPGATYIYERANGTIYAREQGSDPSARVEVGYQYDSRTNDGRPLHDHIMDDKLWGEIRRAAKSNLALHEALEHAKMLYLLSKDYPNG